MRAVNLIPVEERRGGSGSGSGPPTVWLLVVLGVLVVALAGYVLASNQVSERQAKLAQISAQADGAQASVARLKPYVDFASLEQNRTQTVRQLAASRFDWHQSLHDLARVMSKDVWLTSVTGSVSPNVALDGGGGSGGGGGGGGSGAGLRSALPNPALSISGCATSNDQVVSFVSRLRVMNGVIRVALSDAQKSDTTPASGGASSGAPASGASAASGAGAGGGNAAGGGDCTNGSDKFPKFDVVVFYQPLAGAVVASGTAGSATPASAPGASATPKGATTTPVPGTSGAHTSPPGASSPAGAGVAK